MQELISIFKLTPMERKCLYDSEGVEDVLPPNMVLWHIDYFDLKALEKQQVPEGHSELPFFPEIGN